MCVCVCVREGVFVGGQEDFVGDVGLNKKSVKVDSTGRGDALH